MVTSIIELITVGILVQLVRAPSGIMSSKSEKMMKLIRRKIKYEKKLMAVKSKIRILERSISTSSSDDDDTDEEEPSCVTSATVKPVRLALADAPEEPNNTVRLDCK
jgi:hypothetical protein